MFESIVQPLSSYLHEHPTHGGIITGLIAFAESLAVVGSIIPGSVTMTMIGVLVGMGVLGLKSTILWAVFGALCGDYTSYAFGWYYRDHVRQFPFMQRFQSWINQGERFIKNHGIKSIIIGRFFGPMRSMIPMVAGLLNMQPSLFTAAVIPSALLWAIVYLTPGIILGAFSLDLPHHLSMRFVISVISLLVLGLLGVWLGRRSLPTLTRWRANSYAYLWQRIKTLSPGFARWLGPQAKLGQQQLEHLSASLLYLVLFLYVLIQVLSQGWLTSANHTIYSLLASTHTPFGRSLMTGITLLGNKWVVLCASMCCFLWLLFQDQKRLAYHWLGLIVSTAGITKVLKVIVAYPRPSLAGHPLLIGSFPSGHAVLSVTLAMFCLSTVSPQLNKAQRGVANKLLFIYLGGVLISRLYLGAHWATDMLGAILLSLFLVRSTRLSYLRQKDKASKISPAPLVTIATTGLLLGWTVMGMLHFTDIRDRFTPHHPPVHVKEIVWHHPSTLPHCRTNRFGKSSHAMNVQWRGSPRAVIHDLQKLGWTNHPPQNTTRKRVKHMLRNHSFNVFPLFPELYLNNPPMLVLTKPHNQGTLVLKLWPSTIYIGQDNATMLVGTLSYYIAPHRRATHPHPQAILESQAALGLLAKDARRTRSDVQQTTVVPDCQHWNGQLLQIHTPT